MSVVIDASVWVASAKPSESHHIESRDFLRRIRRNGIRIFCPTLVLPECVSAIVRPTSDELAAYDLLQLIEAFPNLTLVPVTTDVAQHAARIARDCRLRGADSVYVAVAEQTGSTLITLDVEVVNRSAPVVRAVVPHEWA